MRQARKVQILLPSVLLGAVLGMPGAAFAGQAGYVRTTIPGGNADGLAPGDTTPAPGTTSAPSAPSKPSSRLNPNNDIDIDIDIDTKTDGGNGDDANTETESGS
jgi:hypothetical protein